SGSRLAVRNTRMSQDLVIVRESSLAVVSEMRPASCAGERTPSASCPEAPGVCPKAPRESTFHRDQCPDRIALSVTIEGPAYARAANPIRRNIDFNNKRNKVSVFRKLLLGAQAGVLAEVAL